MKKILIMMSFLSLNLFAADAPSGCLVSTKKRIVVDTQCKCLSTNSCAKPVPVTFDEKYFSAVDKKTKKPIYPEKEKKLAREATEVYNKIMALKAVGKRNDPETNKLYTRLSILNKELEKEIRKNHPQMMAQADKRNAENMKKFKAREKRRADVLKAYVHGNKPQLNVDNTPLALKNENSSEKKEAPPVVKKEVQQSPVVESPVVKKDDLSEEDKANILNNIKEKDYQTEESDSIFEKISKAYKGKAYKKLLQPQPKSK